MMDPAESDFFAGDTGDSVRAIIDPGDSISFTGDTGGVLASGSLRGAGVSLGVTMSNIPLIERRVSCSVIASVDGSVTSSS